MDILNQRSLKDQAAQRLSQQDYSPRRLALIHAGLIFLGLIAGTGINYYVNHAMDSAQGLSGMGLLSALETVQVVLENLISILLPFWQMGFIFAALRISRSEQVRPASLKEGFLRFGPVLRLMLLRGLIFGGLLMLCTYAGVMIYAATPLAQPLLDLMMPLVQPDQSMEQLQELVWQLPPQQVMTAATPAFIIVILLCLLVMVPVFYRFRLADLIVMDKPNTGALAALSLSGMLTRKRKLALLRLDLSFWWYFLLQLACTALCYLNLLTSNSDLTLVGYVLGQAAQVLVFCHAGSRFHTTWAVAYDRLLQSMQAPSLSPAPPSWGNNEPQKG